jgi:shikimate kinase
MMGSGKTTVGRLLAERLGRPFFDSDEMVEARTGRSVREIFESDGEAAYRPLETDALRDALASPTPAVIAAAGGVVLSAENRAALRRGAGLVVWLQADPAVLAERAVEGAGGHRPLLDQDPVGTMARLADQRAGLYREVADVVVDVTGRRPEEVVKAIVA